MNEIYNGFLARIAQTDSRPSLVRIYHGVRNIRYGSTGVRDPREVVRLQVGSCSGKHILLRDLLRNEGYEAEIITMFTHFNQGIPVVESYPEELKRMCREEAVPDYHHYVRIKTADGWLKLDATWQDALLPFGFPVNHAWDGSGETTVAASPIEEFPNVEDLITFKKEMIATLPTQQQELRIRYFTMLTEWIDAL